MVRDAPVLSAVCITSGDGAEELATRAGGVVLRHVEAVRGLREDRRVVVTVHDVDQHLSLKPTNNKELSEVLVRHTVCVHDQVRILKKSDKPCDISPEL